MYILRSMPSPKSRYLSRCPIAGPVLPWASGQWGCGPRTALAMFGDEVHALWKSRQGVGTKGQAVGSQGAVRASRWLVGCMNVEVIGADVGRADMIYGRSERVVRERAAMHVPGTQWRVEARQQVKYLGSLKATTIHVGLTCDV